MEKRVVVPWKKTADGVFVSCPVCRAGRLLQLYPETRAADFPAYCRRCRRVSVFDVKPGESADRVTLRRVVSRSPRRRKAMA